MIARKVSAIVILWFMQVENYVVSTTKIECMPLKLCPLAMKLVKSKPYAPETIEFLRYSHCGFDGGEPKVWCTVFLYCQTPDSRNGTCKNIKECDSFLEFMRNVNRKDPVVKKYLKEFRCNTEHDSEIKVCCPNEGKMNVFTMRDVHERFSSFLPDAQMGECGRQNWDNKIVGGSDTYLDEYPWLALFRYVKGNRVQYACGGSLINEEYIVTAAHCVDPEIIKQKDLGKLQNVILGEYDTRNETDCIYQKYGEDCADPPQIFTVKDYTLHPDYDSKFMINDIAILRLNKKATFSDYVQPICLPPADFTFKGNETFAISGWGRTETEKRSPIKKKAMVKLVDRNRCNEYNGRRNLTNGQICAGTGNGVDSCFGDSGGPLMLDVRTKSGSFASYAVGIVSYGYGQLCGSFPGVYTYLPAYLNWINNEIR